MSAQTESKPTKTLATRVSEDFATMEREEKVKLKQLELNVAKAREQGQDDILPELQELASIASMKAYGYACGGKAIARKAEDAQKAAEAEADRAARAEKKGA